MSILETISLYDHQSLGLTRPTESPDKHSAASALPFETETT